MDQPTSTHKEVKDTQSLRRLSSFIKSYKGLFLLLILSTFLLGILAPLGPYLVQLTIDQYIIKGDYEGLVSMTLLMLTVVAIQGLAQYVKTYLGDWIGQQVVKDTRIQLYAHILRLRTSFTNKIPIGQLVTRNISDTEILANVFRDGMAALLSDLLQVLIIIGLMFYLNWRLAILCLALLPLIIVVTYIFKELVKEVFETVRSAVARLNSFVQEHIVCMSIIQLFGQEQYELGRFNVLNKAHRDASIRSVKYYTRYFPLINMINSVSVSLLIWYGARGIISGITSFGELVAFLMYVDLFFRPLHMLADRFNTLQMGLVSIGRIMRLLENGEEVENTGLHTPKQLKGDIVFQHVWFHYEAGNDVLRDLSFHLEAKKSLAIVGATGAGKSTIINLIDRFYDIQKGEIRIDGLDIKAYELGALRKHIGVVLQDVFLFSGSIYENITLRDKRISKEQVIEATKLLGLHDFIIQLPGGYNYNVMERGMTLSMGQRQLLSFARMLVYNPAILILDEATASLGTENERLIQKAMTILMKDRTCILIAHRLDTIRHADNIMVLDYGKVAEVGTHDELMAKGGVYSSLYDAS